MNDPRGPGAQPRTKVIAIAVATDIGEKLDATVTVSRHHGTFSATPKPTDLPDDVREALAEWLYLPKPQEPQRITRPAGHG